MELRIQAIHFNATDKLNEFIEKKLAKIAKKNEQIQRAEVTLKVIKPETANNKEIIVHLTLPGGEVRAEKIADTFEEGFDLCLDGLKRQLEKYKDKHTK
ncbi:MAG: ribosome-associated translation inhibitor RaiA [Alloprevotella sp.]|nr:ribosome-associated translation inhibitor RaiA [Alloprevotella sp.]